MRAQHHQVVDPRTAPARVASARSPVATLVSGPAASVSPTASIADAARLMQAERVSALVVEQGGGIITERDVARGVAAGDDPAAPVTSLATRHAVFVEGTTSILRAAEVMLNQEVRHLLVHLPDRVTGVISLRDVVAALLAIGDPQAWVTSLRVTVDVPSEIWLG